MTERDATALFASSEMVERAQHDVKYMALKRLIYCI